MKAPMQNMNIQTLEDHLEYAKGSSTICTRLEICYYLWMPLLKAYEDKYWD